MYVFRMCCYCAPRNEDDGDDDEIEYLFVDVRKIQKKLLPCGNFPANIAQTTIMMAQCVVSHSRPYSPLLFLPSFLLLWTLLDYRLTTMYIVRIIDFVNHLNIYLAYLENKVTF